MDSILEYAKEIGVELSERDETILKWLEDVKVTEQEVLLLDCLLIALLPQFFGEGMRRFPKLKYERE